MSDLSHTIVVQPNLFIRFFIWFWDCAGARLNTCLIFWGTLFILILWPFRLLGLLLSPFVIPVFRYLDNRLTDRRRQQRAERLDRLMAQDAPDEDGPDEPKQSSRGTRLLTRIAHAGSLFWYKFQTPLTWAFRIIIGLSLLFLIGFGIYGLTTIAWSWTILWATLEFIGLVLAAFAAAGIIMILVTLVTRRGPKIKRHTIRRIYRSVHDHTCANVIIEGQESSRPVHSVYFD